MRRATEGTAGSINVRINFYPRSPCGERPSSMDDLEPSSTHFYPRSPCGERLHRSSGNSIDTYFYPRSPCGERLITCKLNFCLCLFLSTLSLRRATLQRLLYVANSCISIHALLAESDRAAYRQASLSHRISIHALLAESDMAGVPAKADRVYFYPRSPCGERPPQGCYTVT